MTFVFSLVILFAVWGAQYYLRSFLIRYIRSIFTLSTAFIFAYLLYVSYLQYQVFNSGIFHGFLFTTWNTTFWFVRYIEIHLWNPYLVSFFVGIGLFFLLSFLNRKFHERFFEAEEPVLIGLSVFLVGYPGLLFYLFSVLLFYFFAHLYFTFIARDARRIPLYPLWFPLAIFVILITHFWLRYFPWWKQFVF